MGWIDTEINILEFTLSSLLRRKGKNIGLLLVYTLVVGVLASVFFFTGAVKKEASLVLDKAPEIMVQRMVAGRHDLIPSSYIDRIKGIRGVRSVTGRLWGYHYDPAIGANYTIVVQEKLSHEQGSVVIGAGIARARAVEPGDVFPFRTRLGAPLNLKVKEIISPESELVSSDLMLMHENDFRLMFGIPPGLYTDIVLEVRNPLELATISQKITDIMPDTRPIIRDEILRTYESVFNWRGGMMIAVLGGALLAFIIFAWDRASGLSAEERREIGILKALGWETSDVLRMKVFEGLAISLSAYLVGVLLAYIHVFMFDTALFAPALKGWSVLYPQFRLLPVLDPYELSALLFLSVVPYTAATVVPSWRAATMDPDSVMRE